MRVAALYDIHGNLPALEAVLADIECEGVDGIVVGGDVLPGPIVTPTLDRLRHLTVPAGFIRGNGERETLAMRAGHDSGGVPERYRGMVRWVAEQMTDDDECWLSAWPVTTTMAIEGLGDVLFCHATPRNDVELVTRLTRADYVREMFGQSGASVVVCGHTHVQFDRVCGPVRVVNAGVGMPFEQPAGAYWALLGPTVELRRTAYDADAAAAALRATACPQLEELAVRYVLDPPGEQWMLDSFAGADIR
jgi:predicted phosphodiesterase